MILYRIIRLVVTSLVRYLIAMELAQEFEEFLQVQSVNTNTILTGMGSLRGLLHVGKL